MSKNKQTSKTKYTNYSMTSSVIRRNQGLQNVDNHFDKIFDEYADEEIGALDMRPINEQGATIEDDLVKQTVEQFEQQQAQSDEKIELIALEKTKLMARRLIDEEEKEEATTTVLIQEEPTDGEKWDCQSILSTYSNLSNHPKIIRQIRLSQKTGLPLVEKKKKKIESESDEEEEEEEKSSITFERRKGETSDERRARKQAIKDMRRERRIIKKSTKVLFKQEEQKQLHEQTINSAQAHFQSLRVT